MRTDLNGGRLRSPGMIEPSVRRVLEHIDENFAKTLRLSTLAELAGLSLHRLITVFRRRMGMPPHQYLCRIRVQHVRRLLRQGLSAAAVAIESGFCDQSHLSRHFKRQYGVTPGHFALTSRNHASLNEASPCA